MQEIGDYFGLHYSRINKIVRMGGQDGNKRPDLVGWAIFSS
uniref:Uncharacterized protein n=1 Tax=Candidatus Kentrum sp. TUN TaxID=2126343 RepID=A0A451A154_9GAMM|nr:MAG: hypothetical protein BECKTUN1418D_GA0071000_11087 [Candidatus Kentron sp. TUN]